jgi:DeoR/GlpR family transcriptional regulator of sugar metabolism
VDCRSPVDEARLMLVPDRQRRLLEQLRHDGSAQVEQLAAALGVSASTVRRDLTLLEADGLLVRAHGGAYLPDHLEQSRPAPPGNHVGDLAAKERIGRAAAARLTDGMTVMILAGSTTNTLLPHLRGRSLTVVTNGLDVAHAVASYPEITLVMLGGILHRDQMTLLGPMTEQNMADLHVDIMFAGAYGIAADVGVTGNKVIQAGHHHSMLRHADALVVLADASKFGRRGPTLLADIDQVDTFVTDAAAPAEVIGALQARGAQVTTC